MRSLLLVAVLAVPVAASAQTMAGQIDVLSGSRLLGKIELTPATAGDELLFQNRIWSSAVFVAKLHPTKSGPGGIYGVGGLCIESAMAFPFVPDTVTIADLDANGIDDIIGIAGAQFHVFLNPALAFCR